MEDYMIEDVGCGDDQQGPKCSEKCQNCCNRFGRRLKKIVSFLISHIGLLIIVVSYCLIGALIFERIEKDNELKVKDSIHVMRNDVTDDIWRMTNDAKMLKEDEWINNVNKRMRTFELDLITSMRKKGWNGHESHDKTQWTFSGSLFYSIICITTIGYGDQTPKTPTGKLVTVIYAILGMPLMLLCLTNTGYAMAHSFRFIYWHICCFLCISSRRPSNRPTPSQLHRRRGRSGRSVGPSRSMSVKSTGSSIVGQPSIASRRSVRRMRRATTWNINQSIVDIVAKQEQQNRQLQDGILSNTKSAVGQDDNDMGIEIVCQDRPNSGGGITRNDSRRSVPPGMRLSINTRNTSGETGSNPSSPGRRSFKGRRQSGSVRSNRTIEEDYPLNVAPAVMDYPVDDPDYFEEIVKKKDIPLWICGLLVLGYVLAGAALFSRWERWRFLDSAYFCFVTLTTIGFGDFVPKAEKQFNAEVGILLCSIYLLFGMSLLVMTFNLVQQRVVNEVRTIAQRMGIIKMDDYEFD